jgi:hypothetical protein
VDLLALVRCLGGCSGCRAHQGQESESSRHNTKTRGVQIGCRRNDEPRLKSQACCLATGPITGSSTIFPWNAEMIM